MSASGPSEARLAAALAECERLREENHRLRERFGFAPAQSESPPAVALVHAPIGDGITAKSSPDEKVKLFRSLFRGRDDVYAVRWEGRDGKKGYSPAYRREWGTPQSDEPKEYFPLTDQVLHDHSRGFSVKH